MDIAQVVQLVLIAIDVQEVVTFVIVVAIHAMMYIIGAVGLLLFTAAAELEMENNVQIMFNYLNDIVKHKFGKQCIHCKYRNHYNQNGNAESMA